MLFGVCVCWCQGSIIVKITFICALVYIDTHSEMQLLVAGCLHAASRLQADTCWQRKAQQAVGRGNVKRAIASCHAHLSWVVDKIFPGGRKRHYFIALCILSAVQFYSNELHCRTLFFLQSSWIPHTILQMCYAILWLVTAIHIPSEITEQQFDSTYSVETHT